MSIFVKEETIMNTLVHTGSFLGNLTGTVLFLYFQGCGILFSGFLLRKKDMITRLLCGSVLGSVLLMWTPALFSFIFSFSKLSHILAAGSCTLILFLLVFSKLKTLHIICHPENVFAPF